MKYGWRWNSDTRAERDAWIMKLRAKGMSHAAIGREFNITSVRVSQIVRKILDSQRAKVSDDEISGTPA